MEIQVLFIIGIGVAVFGIGFTAGIIAARETKTNDQAQQVIFFQDRGECLVRDIIKPPSLSGHAISIGYMLPGQVGYAVPWAFDRQKYRLNPDYMVHGEGGGTGTMKVTCIRRGVYDIEFGDGGEAK